MGKYRLLLFAVFVFIISPLLLLSSLPPLSRPLISLSCIFLLSPSFLCFFPLLPPSSPSSLSFLSSSFSFPFFLFIAFHLFSISSYIVLLLSFLSPHPLHSSHSLSFSRPVLGRLPFYFSFFSLHSFSSPLFPRSLTCLFSFFPTSLPACFVLPLPLLSIHFSPLSS